MLTREDQKSFERLMQCEERQLAMLFCGLQHMELFCGLQQMYRGCPLACYWRDELS